MGVSMTWQSMTRALKQSFAKEFLTLCPFALNVKRRDGM